MGVRTLTHQWAGAPATNDNAGCNDLIADSTWNATDSVCETTYLHNTVELFEDGIGNDNGLIESSETCLYTPNIGSYPGHGALINAGYRCRWCNREYYAYAVSDKWLLIK